MFSLPNPNLPTTELFGLPSLQETTVTHASVVCLSPMWKSLWFFFIFRKYIPLKAYKHKCKQAACKTMRSICFLASKNPRISKVPLLADNWRAPLRGKAGVGVMQFHCSTKFIIIQSNFLSRWKFCVHHRISTCWPYSSDSTCQPFWIPPTSMKTSNYPLEPVRPIQVFKKVSKIFVLLGALTIHDIQNFLSSNCVQVSRFQNVLLLCQSYPSSFIYLFSVRLQHRSAKCAAIHVAIQAVRIFPGAPVSVWRASSRSPYSRLVNWKA